MWCTTYLLTVSTVHVKVVPELLVLHQVFPDLGGVDPSDKVLQVAADQEGWVLHNVGAHSNMSLENGDQYCQ